MRAVFERALDESFARCSVTAGAVFGPLLAELHFEHDAARDMWISALLPRPEAQPANLSVAFVSDPSALTWLLDDDPKWARYIDEDDMIAYWQGPPMSLLHIYDKRTRRGIVWAASGEPPERIKSRPMLHIIHAALLDTPWMAIHSGAVGRDGRFLVLSGGPGVGKTTATISCATAGWDFAGEDFILMHSETGEIAPLYTSARTRTNAPAALHGLIAETKVAFTDIAGDVRSELRLADTPIGSRIGGGRLAAWLIPRRRGSPEPVFEPAHGSAAFGALMPVTASRFPFGRDLINRKIFRGIRNAPLYFVDTGTDPLLIPAAFERFLSELPQ